MLTQMSTCGWMRDIWSEENDGFIEDLGPDLEAEIGEGLHALHRQDGVSNTLHLSVHGGLAGENEHDQLCMKK